MRRSTRTDIARPPARRMVEMHCLKALVSSAFSVREADLGAPSRCRANIAFGRQVAIYLAHVAFGMPLAAAGRAFGRTRQTAAHACRTVEDRRDDRRLDYMLDRLEGAARLWADAAASGATAGHG